VLIVDAEDDWTAMLVHQVRTLGMTAEIYGWNEIDSLVPPCDVVLAGPGPGDPTTVPIRESAP
jgi:phenazine biosynthesis protein phzE